MDSPGQLDLKNEEFESLNHLAMVKGIGRTVTDEELADYLSKDIDVKPIDLEIAFSKYPDKLN